MHQSFTKGIRNLFLATTIGFAALSFSNALSAEKNWPDYVELPKSYYNIAVSTEQITLPNNEQVIGVEVPGFNTVYGFLGDLRTQNNQRWLVTEEENVVEKSNLSGIVTYIGSPETMTANEYAFPNTNPPANLGEYQFEPLVIQIQPLEIQPPLLPVERTLCIEKPALASPLALMYGIVPGDTITIPTVRAFDNPKNLYRILEETDEYRLDEITPTNPHIYTPTIRRTL